MSRFVSRQLRHNQREAARQRRANLFGVAFAGAIVASFGAMFYVAAAADAAHGISVSESLRNNGIHGAAYVAEAFESERPAVPVRLIGKCNGRILAALEESSFPAGCEWIEEIHAEEDLD